MKTMHVAVAVALLCAMPTTFAQTPQSAAWAPQAHHENGVTWVSGGIGKDEADAMRALASRYDLRLVMAEAQKPRAAYLADIAVKITDANGKKVLDIRSKGPLLFLKLPPGRYTVSADVAGRTLTRAFTVKEGISRQAALIWPAGTA